MIVCLYFITDAKSVNVAIVKLSCKKYKIRHQKSPNYQETLKCFTSFQLSEKLMITEIISQKRLEAKKLGGSSKTLMYTNMILQCKNELS